MAMTRLLLFLFEVALGLNNPCLKLHQWKLIVVMTLLIVVPTCMCASQLNLLLMLTPKYLVSTQLIPQIPSIVVRSQVSLVGSLPVSEDVCSLLGE